MDLLSRKSYPRESLIRLALLKDKGLVLDEEGTIKSRGIYLYPDEKTLAKVKAKGLLRRYQKKIDDSLYEEISDAIKRREKQ